MSRPGQRLRRLAARVCSSEDMTRYIDPAIADLQFECDEAHKRGRRWHARWCRIVHLFAVLQIVAMRLAARAARRPGESTEPSGGAWGRAIAGATAAVCVVTGLLTALSISNAPPRALTPTLVLYLLPSVLPLTVPGGLAVAIVLAISSHAQARRAAIKLLAVAGAFSVVALLTLGWATPLTNQAYRVTVFGGPVAKGFNELTLPELKARLIEPVGGQSSRSSSTALSATADAEMSYQTRIAASFAAVPLCLFALALCGRAAIVRVPAAVLVSSIYFALYALLPAPAQTFDALPIALVAWLPNIGSSAAALLLWRLPARVVYPSRST